MPPERSKAEMATEAEERARAVRGLLERPFQVIAGKGGVGRTVLSSAIALRSARDGARTLLLEVNAPDNAARYLEVAPAPEEPRQVAENLWLCRMTPAGAMREYALMVLKFKALYHVVFENRLVKYLLRSIPSLAEFTMLGKAWYHGTERRSDGSPTYQRVVVDAPATGHAITFLSVARVVADTVPSGIMKTAAERMAELVESPSGSCMHIVATPEEMPVNEGLDLVAAARARIRIPPGLAIMNRLLEPLLVPDEESVFARLEENAGRAVEPFIHAARFRLGREMWQGECSSRFQRASGLPLVRIPAIEAPKVDRGFLAQVVAKLDEAART
jgi:Mrp family chromosome partitioning ATPase